MRPPRVPPPRPRRRRPGPLGRHARRHPLRRGRTSPRPPHDLLRQPRHGQDGRRPPPRQGVPRAGHTQEAQVPRGGEDGPHRRRPARHHRQDQGGAGGGEGRHTLHRRGVHPGNDLQALPRRERGQRRHERDREEHRHRRGGEGLAAGHTRWVSHGDEPLPGPARRAAQEVRRHVRVPGLHPPRARGDLRGPGPRQGVLPRRVHPGGLHRQAAGEEHGRPLEVREEREGERDVVGGGEDGSEEEDKERAVRGTGGGSAIDSQGGHRDRYDARSQVGSSRRMRR
mmetsp:Transcript_52433/g.111395  ORF Transcript_52433/g.111395 Transcript_52433/m.111395 type:complete len:283 (+) Transcript_52433:247-1095(+)